ncbi:MAG: metal-sensing transcriptional repressor [Salinisphaera sp.]|jgi:DNA-binding FrmR family transcriptional regulator|nr:metal-sensing transcriptional repressor [Salinisphaera sp.]
MSESAEALDLEEEWEASKGALIRRLKRVEGQVRGLQAMIERDAECEDVAVQMSAARKALDRTFYNMLSCVIERELSCRHLDAHDARARLKYATDLLSRYG